MLYDGAQRPLTAEDAADLAIVQERIRHAQEHPETLISFDAAQRELGIKTVLGMMRDDGGTIDLLCDCGVDLNTVDFTVQENASARVVVCGCGKALHIYGPDVCSHDEPVCAEFLNTCSHRLFAKYQSPA